MAETPWLTDDEMSAWRAWVTVTTRITRAIEHDLREASGLTLDDYEVLVHLSEAPDQRLRLTALAERVANSQARMSQRINRLAGKGLVVRQRCEEDGRGFWALLTPEGAAELREAAPAHVGSVRRHLIDRLEEHDVAAIADVLGRLASGDDPRSM
ncbi:MAG: MarR family transcriptional regulator [Actinomycetota bacterium]|nr:MarR family transcriptional regulator [Actinomycetota bacterium]